MPATSSLVGEARRRDSPVPVELGRRAVPQLDDKRSAPTDDRCDIVAPLGDKEAAVATRESHGGEGGLIAIRRRGHAELAAALALGWLGEQDGEGKQRALVSVLRVGDGPTVGVRMVLRGAEACGAAEEQPPSRSIRTAHMREDPLE